ncbi:hypothetical protein HW452_15800 [Halomonas aquamarina]|uniref:Uncharacterized protein n=1 Tax=Vreelandella aquamarina TaxID=77097 RepID=A0ACC5VXI6_9GAMM|nr:hypothetical protein [Halomonas aquamarina]MBZ5488988.1 hypothetical protein [Halomonas aquamarina]
MKRTATLCLMLSIMMTFLPLSVASDTATESTFAPSDASSAHPAEYYQYAAELFSKGDQEEAAFWFYAGQLRYRIHLTARPDLPPSGDPALFASLHSVVGQQINGYLGGEPDIWKATIKRVLAWDEATENAFTPKREYPEAHAEQRQGLEGLLEELERHY